MTMSFSGQWFRDAHSIVSLVPREYSEKSKLGTAETRHRHCQVWLPKQSHKDRWLGDEWEPLRVYKGGVGEASSRVGLGYSSRTYSAQGLQRPSRPAEKVPMAQSTHSKPNLIFPVDRQTDRL